MITAVSNFKENSSNVKLNKVNTSENLNNFTRSNFSQSITQVSFKGLNVSKIKKNILGDIGSNLGKKVIRFAAETAESARMLFRKLKGRDELPFTEKSITCDIYTNDKMQDELEKAAAERVVVSSRKKDAENLIRNSGHSVDSGDIDPSGYITSSGQKKVDNPTSAHRHHEDFTGNSDHTSFRGSKDNPDTGNLNDLNEADLEANDGINDVDNANLAHADGIDGHHFDLDNPEELSLEDFNAKELDTDIDFDGHNIDIDSTNLDADGLDLAHADDLDIGSHNLDNDDLDFVHTDDLDAADLDVDVDPDIDLPDIDPSDLF